MRHDVNTELGRTDRGSRGHRHKRWLFRAAAILLALLPFFVLEIAVRWSADLSAEAVDLHPLHGLQHARPLFVLNDEQNRWVIPPEKWNFFRPDSFAKTKGANTRRVFVLGGSTVQGRPYATETAFSTWLRFRLEAADPTHAYEVVNCGGVSYASYRVAKILDEVLGHQPDAIVLYTGHNEFLEDRAYRDVRSMGSLARAIDGVGSYLQSVRWLKHRWATPPENRPALASEVDTRLDHVGGLESFRRDPAWREAVEAQYTVSLRYMIDAARRAAVPLILCVPAGDLARTPPFKVEPAPGLAGTSLRLFEKGWSVASHQESTSEDRITSCRFALSIDPEHAGAHYVLGSLLFELRRDGHGFAPEETAQHLTAARDFDVCPLRATSPIVAAARDAAASFGLPTVDVPTLLDLRNAGGAPFPDGIPDPSFFVDHVHPSVLGHQRIAAELARCFEELGWIEVTEAATERYRSAETQHLDSLGEDYYHRGLQRLEGLRRWASGRAGTLGASQPLPGEDSAVPQENPNE